jgi:hypothetical protein
VSCDGDAGVPDASVDTTPAPRPIAPLSVSSVTSQQPTLRWQLAAGADGAHVELCHDRACTKVITSFDATGSQGKPSAALAAGFVFWRLASRTAGSTSTVYSPVWEFVVGHRSAPVDTSWGSVFDVNGDGYADVGIGNAFALNDQITGETQSAPASRQARVYHGGPSGLPATPSTLIGGASPPASFGANIANLGDVNGDGFPDLGISNYVAPAGTVAGSATFAVYLGGPSGAAVAPQFTSANLCGAFGCYVEFAGVGDLNGDGYADVAVSTLNASHPNPNGAVQVYLGSATGLSATPGVILSVPNIATSSSPGGCVEAGMQSLFAAADFNGDGYGDLATASSGYTCAGAVYVYLGGPNGPAPTPSASLSTTYSVAGSGSVVDFGMALGVADTDGDGFPELLIGSNTQSVPGSYNVTDSQLQVIAGDSTGLYGGIATLIEHPGTNESALPGGEFGSYIASAGDVDGDGFEDVLLSDIGASSSGRGYIYRGGPTGLPKTPSQTLSDPNPNDYMLGQNVMGLGDVNGDGYADVFLHANSLSASVISSDTLYLGGKQGASATPGASFAYGSPLIPTAITLAGFQLFAGKQ